MIVLLIRFDLRISLQEKLFTAYGIVFMDFSRNIASSIEELFIFVLPDLLKQA